MSIEVSNISKTFGTYKALDRVSLTVNEGELVALLGPSGSGKTTLLRIIAGLEFADEETDGHILFHGNDVANQQVRQRNVGFVFQHYALFKHLSVFENIAFGLRVRPRASRPSKQVIRDRVMELLKLIQLESFGNRYPSQLSGGQRQRVALARALAIEPQVLLLDEPFGALDAKVRQGLRNWLRQLHKKLKMTTILVTHDQEEALEVADRVVVMNQAKIAQVGTPEEVFHKPASEFVIDFLGSVNVFHGRVDRGQAVLLPKDGKSPEVIGKSGSSASIYVRPHELEVSREPSNADHQIRARVTRINPAGSIAKISLVDDERREIQVDLTFQRLAELQLQSGETVYLYPRKVHFFLPDDYAI